MEYLPDRPALHGQNLTRKKGCMAHGRHLQQFWIDRFIAQLIKDHTR